MQLPIHRLLCLAAASLSTALCCSCTSPGTPPAGSITPQKIVRIAANLPMTGDLSVYGTCIHDGSALALKDLAISDPSGPALTFDWQDNAGKPPLAVSIMQKQFLEPPDIYVSGVHPQAMAIKEQIETRGTPHFIWVFDQSLNKSRKAGVGNNFRTYVNLKIEAPVLLNYVKARHPRRVAIIYVRLSHTQEEFENDVVPALRRMGIADIFIQSHAVDFKDFKTTALKLNEFKPDLIIVDEFQDGYVGLLRAVRPLGLIRDGNTIASYDMVEAAKLLGKDEVDGICLVTPKFAIQPQTPAVKAWTQNFFANKHRLPLTADAYAYDSVMIMHDAARRLALPASSKQWIKALQATKITGLTGPLSFDDDGSLRTPIQVGIYRNGELVAHVTPSSVR